MREYARLNPVLFRSGPFHRMEERLPAPAAFPRRKLVRYVADVRGAPLVIQLVMPVPSKRWEDALARFESTLRIEDGEAGR